MHDHAKEDIRALRRSDPDAAAAVLVTLAQIQADPLAIDKLTTYGDNQFGSQLTNVKPWEVAQRRKKNLWRFRALNTPATSYRIFYGYHWPTQHLCVLAVVHKDDFDYDNLNTDIARRILRDWDGL